MLFLITVAVIIVVTILDQCQKRYKSNRTKDGDFFKLRGPEPLPLIGNAMLFWDTPENIFKKQQQMAKDYEGLFRITLGNKKIIAVSDPFIIEKILSSNAHLQKPPIYSSFNNWLGNGLITGKVDTWKKHRTILNTTFTAKHLKHYAIFIQKNLKKLTEVIRSNEFDIVNVNQFIKRFAFDTICETAMRSHFNLQDNKKSPYVKYVRRYVKIQMQRMFTSLLRIPIIFKLSGLEREHKHLAELMNKYTDHVIIKRKKERKENKQNDLEIISSQVTEQPNRCFLDFLLDKQELENALDNTEIRGEINTFLFAGHDSIACAISFILYELSLNQGVQEELVKELYSLLPSGGEIEMNLTNIDSLPLLDKVVKESLRLHSTVPFIERELQEDLYINDLRIPAGTTAHIMIYALHNNDKYYPNPRKFNPERFNTQNSEIRHPFAYIPFSAGERSCIGSKYAMIMMKGTVMNILRNFKISKPAYTKFIPKFTYNAVLQSSNGIHIIFKRRI